MIGNDIIDFDSASANSRWREQRFLDKLFTFKEQEFILKDDLRFQNIWRLWSMKESAYKIYSRLFTSIVFNPKSFRCQVTSKTTGLVYFENNSVNTTTVHSSDFFYTTATILNNGSISEIVSLNGSSIEISHQLKKQAIQTYADCKSLSVSSVSIEKDCLNIPHFCVNKEIQDDVLSLTHHGQYGGFAIYLQ